MFPWNKIHQGLSEIMSEEFELSKYKGKSHQCHITAADPFQSKLLNFLIYQTKTLRATSVQSLADINLTGSFIRDEFFDTPALIIHVSTLFDVLYPCCVTLFWRQHGSKFRRQHDSKFLCHRKNPDLLIHIFVEKVKFPSTFSSEKSNFDPCYRRIPDGGRRSRH